MKRKIVATLCIAVLLCLATSAFASESFTNFKLAFSSTSSYQSIVSDTTSTAKTAGEDYARLYVDSTTSSVNNVYRTYSGKAYTSRTYFKNTTTGTWMYYNTDISQGATVYLRGRPDSSVSSCTVTGKFGAG